jgi:hypothetical protein
MSTKTIKLSDWQRVLIAEALAAYANNQLGGGTTGGRQARELGDVFADATNVSVKVDTAPRVNRDADGFLPNTKCNARGERRFSSLHPGVCLDCDYSYSAKAAS